MMASDFYLESDPIKVDHLEKLKHVINKIKYYI